MAQAEPDWDRLLDDWRGGRAQTADLYAEAHRRAAAILGELGLQLHPDKTAVVDPDNRPDKARKARCGECSDY